MKTKRINKFGWILGLALLITAGCGDEEIIISPDTGDNGGGSAAKVVYKQIERLGRPAVNEGFVISNLFLNALNSIPPSLDLSAIPLVVDVRTQARAVIKAVVDYASGVTGLTPPTADEVLAGFFPDVLRIDTRATIGVGTYAYNGAFTTVTNVINGATVSAAMLTGGRKIEDPSIHITLSYLFNGAAGITGGACTPSARCVITDGTFYDGKLAACADRGDLSKAANPANPGHKCLHMQTVKDGSAKFPYLAAPNI